MVLVKLVLSINALGIFIHEVEPVPLAVAHGPRGRSSVMHFRVSSAGQASSGVYFLPSKHDVSIGTSSSLQLS